MKDDQTLKADTNWIRAAFEDVQVALAHDIQRANRSIVHAPTKGGVNEKHWIDIFRAYLPHRYQLDSAFAIDSLGNRSEQIDIVIYDRHFTPTILDQQQHRYIPAEAIYAIFESKPHIDKDYLEYAGQKAESVRRLQRTSVAITHAGGKFEPRPPFSIVAGIVAPKAAWADGLGESFTKHLPSNEMQRLDCGCALDDGSFDVFDGTLQVVQNKAALIYFLFRLLAKLQSLGSVPAVDWGAYAKIVR
jgi:hypothetical protein